MERAGLTTGFPNPPEAFSAEVRAFLPDFIAQVGEMSVGKTVGEMYDQISPV